MTENVTTKVHTDQIHVAFRSLTSSFSVEGDFSMDFSAHSYQNLFGFRHDRFLQLKEKKNDSNVRDLKWVYPRSGARTIQDYPHCSGYLTVMVNATISTVCIATYFSLLPYLLNS